MSATTTTRTLTHVSTVTIQVKDQDEALRFYTERLGFEKRLDVPMGEGMRWLTVTPAGSATELTLVNAHAAGAPLGANTGIILETDDIDAAYQELSGRGVHFTELPIRHPWGGWASFVDQDGNGFGLHSNQIGA